MSLAIRRAVEARSLLDDHCFVHCFTHPNIRELTNTPWCIHCVSSVAMVNKHKHFTNAVVATVIARKCVWTVMAACSRMRRRRSRSVKKLFYLLLLFVSLLLTQLHSIFLSFFSLAPTEAEDSQKQCQKQCQKRLGTTGDEKGRE